MENDLELWRDVIGWEGIYEVSNHGGVRRVGYPKPLGHLDSGGYPHVTLTERRPVHQLVMEAFGVIPEGCEVHHCDENPQNNRIDNLEAVTHSEHRKRHTGARWRRLTPQEINYIQQCHHPGRGRPRKGENRPTIAKLAKELGVTAATITNAFKRQT